MAGGGISVRDFCLRLLERGDLASKLAPPRTPDGALLADAEPGPAILIDRPVRAHGLEMTAGAGPLPRPGELREPAARVYCLARFAHHELMAAELFAWALLRWPDLPPELRRGWLAALADEQRHCRLYRERLQALGSDLHEHALSDYFWKHVPAIAGSPHGPRAFLSAMGLTLEQANLDFSLRYRDAFRAAGDEESARVCQIVHDDEVGHVRLAATWLARLGDPRQSETERYLEAVPFPLSAARAKGRSFDRAARRRAGLGDDFIEHVRRARSSQEALPRRRPAAPMPPLRLLPNIGAEEGGESAPRKAPPQVTTVAQLWQPLFAAGTRWLDPELLEAPYPEALGARPDAAVFPWLAGSGGVTAWLNTEAAATAAAASGCALTGPPPDVVRSVHDKAFAHAVACCEGWLPPELADTIAVLEPSDLVDADRAVRRLQARLAGWPEWARRRFTLKPRFGSSGRGRVAGSDGNADTEQLRAALPRLAKRGGALLEPWCDRSEDLSAALWLGSDGELVLLGTTRQWLAPSGLYRGQRGTLDSRGRVTSGSERDESLREAAAAVAAAAARRGFRGPCGVDAFAYRSATGAGRFRAVVELNARFTMGVLAIGWLRRSLDAIRRNFDLAPGQRLHFHFGLDAPAGGWPESDASLWIVPLGDDAAALKPALAIAPDRATLERRLGEHPG